MCFCIQFYPDHLQIGRGLACCRFPYELVEMITVQKTKRKKMIYIEIECLNKELKVYLSLGSLANCISMLLNSCHNAIYVDLHGKEHIYIHATRPDFVIKNLRNYYLGKIMVWSLGFIFSLYLDFHFCVILLFWIQGKIVAMDFPFLMSFILAFLSSSVVSFFVLIHYIKKSLYLSREIKRSKIDSKLMNNT